MINYKCTTLPWLHFLFFIPVLFSTYSTQNLATVESIRFIRINSLSGTRRAREMLAVLEAIFPYFLRDLVRDKRTDAKTCRETIHQLTLTMRALLSNCDELTK